MTRQTLGEYRVGVDFNPSNKDTVTEIKRAAAGLIDLIEKIDEPTYPPDGSWNMTSFGEVVRLKHEAMNYAEIAAMLAVKAATKPEPSE